MRMVFRRYFWAVVEQFARYVVIGGGVALVHYVMLFGLAQMGVSPWQASVAGSVIGATFDYFISRQTVFNSACGYIGAMIHFGLMAFPALGYNVTIMTVGPRIGLYYLIAQMFTSSITVIFNFLVRRYWTSRGADAVAAPTGPQPIIVPTRPTHNGP